MVHADLPEGWERPSRRDAGLLLSQFIKELDPAHPAARAPLEIIARDQASDAVLAASGSSPPFFLLFLDWGNAAPRAPYLVDHLADLAAITGPDPEEVDYVTGWTDARTEQGFVLVQHLIGGGEIVMALDWPDDAPPRSSEALAARGWREVVGTLAPKSDQGDALVPTGQTIEYWVRPIRDDFMLFRVIHTPGEPIVLRKLLPADQRLFEFDTVMALEAALPPHSYARFHSPQEVGWGRSALPG